MGVPSKSGYFTGIGSYSVKTVEDSPRHILLIITSTSDELL